MKIRSMLGLAVMALSFAASAHAEDPWIVRPEWVAAHEAFLASDALNGRGSATRDEAIAASYVASQFQGYGLKTAPGMTGYLQSAVIVRPRLDGPVNLTAGTATTTDGLTLLTSSGQATAGALTVFTGDDPKTLPSTDVVLLAPSSQAALTGYMRAAPGKNIKLLIVRESEEAKKIWGVFGNKTSMTPHLDGDAPERPRINIVVLSAAVFDALKAQPGVNVALNLPPVVEDRSTTTNAIGFLPGSDPKAGVILYTAHLDHLGVRPDGVIMHGANDDASGTTAVLEIAHALATGHTPRRSILFVAYGSEEIGEFGSNYFGKHPPVPLTDIVANIEFEMIGAQDPKLPQNTLMMTGFERSDLGEALKAHGALVTGDPYPDEHFFERSDNYQLALQGIVAHTVSGWATTPTYHSPTDDLAHLNLPFMKAAIQSLIGPAKWLADSDFTPQWKPGGKPVR
ncbi:M28 family metallopeptidase [Asticcacaulis solisilvae]|uniref:M28 family metallopeptidase n=1 Tax=Asticcacaulis solisilvae TaxID=1217274 RepID=UPI003FD7DF19